MAFKYVPQKQNEPKPAKSGSTFFVEVCHPLVATITALLASIARGESQDVAGDLKKASAMIETPAVWLGVATEVRTPDGERHPFVKNGKPSLNNGSVWVYTDDPTRERAKEEPAGLLLKAQSNRGPVVTESHPLWEAATAAYQAEIGVAAQVSAQTRIPVGAARAIPVGRDERSVGQEEVDPS